MLRTLKSVLALIVLSVTPALASADTAITTQIHGMHCGSCVRTLTSALKKLPEVEKVEVKIVDAKKEQGMAKVTLKEGSKTDAAAIAKAISDAGYEVTK
jgi:copper chaperone CopZ